MMVLKTSSLLMVLTGSNGSPFSFVGSIVLMNAASNSIPNEVIIIVYKLRNMN